ncbi:hypothetical protein MRB53_023893 [Persea americana]|uniref:Uncharacterized protein n=1 Tax=Persea americana TaxID=3435 RepID=A0ACC2LAV4_PERAE|nr:hypothetical protein MRB53_023893 [Persea americana]
MEETIVSSGASLVPVKRLMPKQKVHKDWSSSHSRASPSCRFLSIPIQNLPQHLRAEAYRYSNQRSLADINFPSQWRTRSLLIQRNISRSLASQSASSLYLNIRHVLRESKVMKQDTNTALGSTLITGHALTNALHLSSLHN